MAAYMIVRGKITNEEQFGRYRQAVLPLIERFGGKQLRTGSAEVLEGAPVEDRIAFFEFPSMESIRTFWDSPDYVPVRELRRGAALLEIWAVPVI